MIPPFEMHYSTFVFIPKDRDIDGSVARMLEPFDESLTVEPWTRHLDQEEIAVMAKHYHVRKTSLLKLAGCMEDWNNGKGGVDADGLFAVHTYNPDGKWDWYEIGGRWDGFVPDNVMDANAMLSLPDLKDRLPHDFVTPDGQWHGAERYVKKGWLGGEFVRKPESAWLAEFEAALKAFPDHRVVCIDRHS